MCGDYEVGGGVAARAWLMRGGASQTCRLSASGASRPQRCWLARHLASRKGARAASRGGRSERLRPPICGRDDEQHANTSASGEAWRAKHTPRAQRAAPRLSARVWRTVHHRLRRSDAPGRWRSWPFASFLGSTSPPAFADGIVLLCRLSGGAARRLPRAPTKLFDPEDRPPPRHDARTVPALLYRIASHPSATVASASYLDPPAIGRDRNSATVEPSNSILCGAGSGTARTRAPRATRPTVTWGRKGRFSGV